MFTKYLHMPRAVRMFMLITQIVAIVWGASPTEDRGKELFARRCGGCHSLDSNKEGPRLRGVYGRSSAGASEFGYSESLKKMVIRWDEATLDRWLQDPDAMAPGTDMAFRVADPGERKAVIAYLKTLSHK